MWNKQSERQKSRLVFLGIILIFLLGIILYSGILHAPFVLDDFNSIVENESTRSVTQSLKNILNNRYLAIFSFAFNYWLGGLNPFGYHLINNLIHSFNALLVYYLVILTFRTPYFRIQNSEGRHPLSDSPIHRFSSTSGGQAHLPLFIAFSAAFIFVSHPIQTQAVTYIVQRATSMATMFYLLSLVMYIKFRIQDKKSLVHRASWIMYLCSLLFAIFAMKTKEIAFTLPVVITLYEFSFFNKSPNAERRMLNLRRFLYLLPILFTLLIIPLSMLNFKAPVETITQDIDIRSRETFNITRTDYLLTQFRVVVTYLRLLILPINQNLDYRSPVYHSFFDLQVFLSFLFLLAIFGLAVYLFYKSRRTHYASRLAAFGIFWFFITLSVESSFIPIRDVIVEHRLYLPSVGFFIAAVLSVEYFFSNNMRLKIALMLVIVLVLSISTYNRNAIWKDPQILWEDVLTKSPGNSRACNNLGVVFKDRGEFDKAIEQFEKSLKADRNYTSVYFNLGDVQYRLGNYENAVSYLTTALTGRLDTQLHLDILNKLGRTYSAMGQNEKAIQTFQRAIQVMPSAIAPYNNLAVQYIKTGQFDLAIEILKKALEIREEPYLLSNLNIAYSKKIRILKHL